jgi:hypothetical protein
MSVRRSYHPAAVSAERSRLFPDCHLRFLSYSAITLFPIIAVSGVMYWLFERPCLNCLSMRGSANRRSSRA